MPHLVMYKKINKNRNPLFSKRAGLMKIALLVLIIVFAFWAGGIVKDSSLISDLIRKFGYVGIFLVAVVSGFNLVIPIPAISFLPIFLASGLNPIITIIILAAGMTLADFVGYLLGKTGRRLSSSAFEERIVDNFEKIKKKLNWSPALALFLFASFAPLPNELVVIPMAFLGYRFSYILVPIFLGNIVFNSIYAVGAISIFKLIS